MAQQQRRARGDGGLTLRKDGIWVGSVEIPPGPEGQRRRRQVTSKDYNVAMTKLRELRRDIEDGLIPVTDSTKLSAWLERWLDEIIVSDVKPTVMVTYRSVVKNQINPHIGSKRLSVLTPADVRTMIRNIVEKDGRSTGTSLQAFRVLSKALTDAKREGLIRDNVCDRVRPPRVVRQSRGSHDLAHVKQLFAYLSETDDPLISRWTMALFTGARQAECLGLEWDRVDFDAKTIDISWTLQWLRLKERYARQRAEVYDRAQFDVDPGFEFRPIWKTACLIPPKTARSRRVIPMMPELEAALRYHRDRSSGEGLVWTREGGKPYRKADDAKAWHAALEAAGIPDLTLHSARHTVASLLQAGGVPEATRMSLMGHSSVAMARHYAHVDQSLARAGLEQLSAALRADPPALS